MSSAPCIDYQFEGGIAVITIDAPPVNALSTPVRAGLVEAFESAIADPAVEAIVLNSAGRAFSAGADITEFGLTPRRPTLRELQQVVERTPKPVVAAIHGAALGGGLELALAVHWRIAVPSARCGLPEVNIGLLPGAGGTQRLPRVAGVEAALEIMTSGRHVPAAEAQALGIVDALVDEGTLREAAIAYARRAVSERWPLRSIREQHQRLEAARGHPEIFTRFRAAQARRSRGLLAPEAIIRCVEAAVNLPFEEGLAVERALFEELQAGPQSAAQRYVFFAERQAGKLAAVPPETPVREVARVGIVGAGTMGGGIAMNFLNAGLPVTIVEAGQAALERGIASVRANYAGGVSKGRLTQGELEERMQRLHGSLQLDPLGDCELVIEAVFEQLDVKQGLFRQLDRVAKSGAILASNTSYLDIDALAACTGRPECVLGLHFFSPANVMRLLEIVRGRHTAREVIATALKTAKLIGKVGVVVGNGHGFVGNRMLAPRQREADRLILEGALPWDVDRVLTEFGFPMGPFAMRDLAGMDLGWVAAQSTSSTVREILNEIGRRGQKSGAGYYDYDQRRVATPSAVVEQLILKFAAGRGIRRRTIADAEILERCLYPMVNEGAKILAEGIAARASDIDVIWVTGFGWPVYRGGPMYWAEREGLAQVLERLRALAGVHGEEFRPAPLLEERVASGRGFTDA